MATKAARSTSTPSKPARAVASKATATQPKRSAAAANGPKVPQFAAKAPDLAKLKGHTVVVGLSESGELLGVAPELDALCGGALKAAIQAGDAKGKKASVTVLRQLPGLNASRVVMVGVGDPTKATEKTAASVLSAAARAVFTLPDAPCVWDLHTSALPDTAWATACSVQSLIEAGYRFDQCKSKVENDGHGPSYVSFTGSSAQSKAISEGITQGMGVGLGMNLTKDLGNLPGNVCTPTYLANTAKALGKQYKLGVDILDQKQMEALGMGSLLSVAKGSVQPPKLIVVKYNGGPAKQAPTVLVGKGITFDTGGISLKPGAEMDEMKYDMCGAASVLGTLRAVAEMKLKLNVIGVIPTCENMPAGNASKPGDIVTSMSGQTIEILNTDAEGRLILCDALTYTERFKPAAVVDIATLTGACVIALGSVNSGLFTADDALAEELITAGKTAVDPAWRMPLDEEYQELLKSNFADMANIGGRGAGAVTAACFLARYTKAYRWAHLDIAGTAWKGGAAKGASGRPVPLLVNFLKARAA